MSTNTDFDFPQYSLTKTFLLSILPGVLTAAAFLLLKRLLDSSPFPPLLAFLLAILLVDLPLLLGLMLVEGKRLNGRYSLDGVVLFREKVPWKTFALVFVSVFALVFVLINLLTPINSIIVEGAFSWLPDWTFLEEQSQYEPYAKNVLVLIFTFQLILTGIILPWVEELYFRGYLLPRISRFRLWAPLLGGLFFALYHIWSLYGFLTVFLLGTVLGYTVWWTRDIRLSISLHVFANVLTRLMFLMAALAL